ncbi:hypothetical protein CYMTET_5066 [Cymbomonas tetramitiformis]|uniref:Uncharacterized protein n=1 Tax=Cymbomonas tetramitiformis TaxID=36881 RepID=A0AAE0LJA2_9CHLO|nr:hypothetical protein CYMTET_5066 [Cymbomonas tetramitiformis]
MDGWYGDAPGGPASQASNGEHFLGWECVGSADGRTVCVGTFPSMAREHGPSMLAPEAKGQVVWEPAPTGRYLPQHVYWFTLGKPGGRASRGEYVLCWEQGSTTAGKFGCIAQHAPQHAPEVGG